MGKATVLENKGEGLYRVRVNYDRTRAERAVEKCQWEIESIDARLPQLQQDIVDALKNLDAANALLKQAVDAFTQSQTRETIEGLRSAQKPVLVAQGALLNARSAKRDAELHKAIAQKRIDFLQKNLPADQETDAWCADYTEGLTGEVGTIEPARIDRSSLPIIVPAGQDGKEAAYNFARDGQWQPVMSGTPASAFWNLAMGSGTDKWRPRFRLGEITALDSQAGTCDIALDPAVSSAQDLNVNQADTLTAVPVDYMSCNADAFRMGDRVVIEFQSQDWNAPRVIGFESHPRPCGLYLTGLDLVKGWDQFEYRVHLGTAPFTWRASAGLAVVAGGGENDETVTVQLTDNFSACGDFGIYIRDTNDQEDELIFDLGDCEDGSHPSPGTFQVTGPNAITCGGYGTFKASGGYPPYSWHLALAEDCLAGGTSTPDGSEITVQNNNQCCPNAGITATDAKGASGFAGFVSGSDCWVDYYVVNSPNCPSGGSGVVKQLNSITYYGSDDRVVSVYRVFIDHPDIVHCQSLTCGGGPDQDMQNQIAEWEAMSFEELQAVGLIPPNKPDYPTGPIVYEKIRCTYENRCGT